MNPIEEYKLLILSTSLIKFVFIKAFFSFRLIASLIASLYFWLSSPIIIKLLFLLILLNLNLIIMIVLKHIVEYLQKKDITINQKKIKLIQV